jgi:hypothetical protein
MSDSTLPKDQLINQIIHQGKAQRKAKAIDTYSESLSVNGCELRPVPGSRDKTTQPIPRGGRSEMARPSKAQQSTDFESDAWTVAASCRLANRFA